MQIFRINQKNDFHIAPYTVLCFLQPLIVQAKNPQFKKLPFSAVRSVVRRVTHSLFIRYVV